jgi:transposase
VSMTAALMAPHDGVMADDSAARPRRRRFSPEDKLAILAEYDRLTSRATRERCYAARACTPPTSWSGVALGDAGALSGLAAQARRPRRTPEQVELERVRRRNQRLEAELARTKAALEIVGKAHALLEQLSESADSEPRSSR